MAATDRRPAPSADAPSDVAAAIDDAAFVQLVAVADGDCLAGAGLLARAAGAADVPYQVSAVRTAAAVADRLDRVDDDATVVGVGIRPADAVGIDAAGPVSPLAAEAAAELESAPDPATVLAGVVAAGGVPSRAAPERLDAAGVDRTPGVAVPTADLADGLAHSTLVHAAFSGDVEAARGTLAEVGLAGADATALDEDAARRVASLVALAAGGAPDATPRAATAVERALRPYAVEGPFPTLAGHADVLNALAERAPGLAVALTAGGAVTEPALDAWRDHATAAHAGVRAAETARYGGLVVARTDGPVAAVARLLRDYRSPEPVVLAVGDGEAAAASLEAPVADALSEAAAAVNGSSIARGTRGYATYDADQTERFVDAFREAR